MTLLRSPLRSVLRSPLYSTLVGKWGGVIVPSNVFPSNLATYDLDFANAQFFGGTQPLGDNANDGRFLRQQIANTQPNFVEKADGSLLRRTVTQEVRYSTRGLALAGDRQNRVLQNRDLTNAAWVKVGCTPLKNQTGRDGVANAASQITVNVDGATCTQAITVTTLDLVGYVDIKRISGSGTCSMSMDAGVTTTVLDLTKPLFNGICRPSIPHQSLANPTVILTFSTTGDVWYIDLVELSDNTGFEFEPVPTVAASVKNWRDRAAAFTTDAGPLGPWLRDQTTQVMYWEYAQRQTGALIASDGDLQISSNAALGVSINSLATANLPVLSTDARLTAINKVMMYRTPSVSAICLNGGVVAKGSGFTPDHVGTHYDWCTNGAGSLANFGVLRRNWFGSLIIPTDAVMQAFTT